MQERLQNDPAYRRLKCSSNYVVGHVSYWLASDHLLLVDVIGFVERYRQFRLADIELIVIRPTRTRMLLGSIGACVAIPLVILAAFLWTLYLGTTDSEYAVGASIASVFAALALMALTLILARGQICQTRLVTGVQEIRLPGMFRLRDAQALADALAAQTQALAPLQPLAPDTPPTAAP
jgi:hypothetical protein